MSLFDKLDAYAERARQILIDKYKDKQIQPAIVSKAKEGAAYWQGYDSSGRAQVKQGGKIFTVNVSGNISIPSGTAVYVDSTGTVEIKKKKKKPTPPPKFEPRKPVRTFPSVNREILTEEGVELRINPVYVINDQFADIFESEVVTARNVQVYTGRDGLIAEFKPWDFDPPEIVPEDDRGLLNALIDNFEDECIVGTSLTFDIITKTLPLMNQVIDNHVYISYIRGSDCLCSAFLGWRFKNPFTGQCIGQTYSTPEVSSYPRVIIDVITFAVNLDNFSITYGVSPLYEYTRTVTDLAFNYNALGTVADSYTGLKEAFLASLPSFHPFKNSSTDIYNFIPNGSLDIGSRSFTSANSTDYLTVSTARHGPLPTDYNITPNGWAYGNSIDSFRIYESAYEKLYNYNRFFVGINTGTGERVTSAHCTTGPVYELAALEGSDQIDDDYYYDMLRLSPGSFSSYTGDLENKEDLINVEGWSESDATSYVSPDLDPPFEAINTNGNCTFGFGDNIDFSSRYPVDPIYFSGTNEFWLSFIPGTKDLPETVTLFQILEE